MAKKKKEEEKKIPVGSYTASPSGYAIDKSLPAKSTTSSASSGATVEKSLPAKSGKSPVSTPRDPTVFRIEVDPKRTVDKSRLFKNDKGRRENDPDKITKGGYVARQAYSGLGHGLSGTEGFIRTAAAKELEQARKANSTKSAADTLFENLFGGTRDTLKSIEWEKGAGLGRNLMNVGGGYIDATGQLIQGLSGAEGIKNWLAGRALEEDAEKSGLSLDEQAELEKNALIGNNNVENALRLNQLDRATEAARERMPWAVRAGGDVANVAASLVPSVAVGAATRNPNVARTLMSASAAGSQAMDALDNGADIDKALRAGYASGASEYALEGLFGGIPVLDAGEGLMNKAITAGASKVLPKEALQSVARFGSTKGGRWLAWAGRKLGEGVEEVASEALRPSIEGIYKNKADIESVTARSLAQSGGLGVAVALLLGGSPNNIRLGKDVSVEQLALADYALRMQMEEEYRAALERDEQARAAAIARQAEQEAAIFAEMRRNNADLRNLDVGRLILQLGEETQSPELDTDWLARQEQEWTRRHQPEEPSTSGLDLMRLGMGADPGYDRTPYMETRANEEAAGGYYRGRDVTLYPENLPPKPTFGLDLISRGLDKQRPVSERLADMQKPAKEQAEEAAPTLSENSILNDVTAEDAAAAQRLIEQNGAEVVVQNLLAGVERQKQMNGIQKYAALLAAEQLQDSDPQTAEQLRSAVFSPADNAQSLIERNGAEETAIRLLAVLDSGRELNPTQIRAAQILAQDLRDTNPELAQQMEKAAKNEGFPAPNEQQGTNAQPAVENASEPLASAENGTTARPLASPRGTYGLTVQEGEGKEQQYGILNTLHKGVEAGVIDEELEDAMAGRTYAEVSNPQVQAAVRGAIAKFGVDKIRNYLTRIAASNQNFNSTQYAAAIELVHYYTANGDFDAADTMMQMMSQAVNDAGRLVQLTKTLAEASPEFYVESRTRSIRKNGHRALSNGRRKVMHVLATAEQQITNGTWDGRISFDGVETIKNPGRAGIVANPAEPEVTEDLGVTEKEKKQRLDAISEIYEEFNIPFKVDNNSIWIDAATEQEQKEIAEAFSQAVLDETGVGLDEWIERINLEVQASAVRTPAAGRVGAARRANMLLQTVSLLVRNPLGNLDQGLREEIADYPAALIGKGLQLMLGGDVNSVNFGKYGALAKGAKRGWKEVNLARKTGTLKLIGHKYGDNESNLDRLDGGDAKNIGQKVLGEAQRQIDDFLTYMLCLGDLSFVEGRQNQVEAQYLEQNEKANIRTEEIASDFINSAGGAENALNEITLKIDGKVGLTDEEQRVAAYLAYMIEKGNLPQESQKAADELSQKLQKAAGNHNYYDGLTEEQKKLADVAGHTVTYTQKGGGSTMAATLRSLGQIMEHKSAIDEDMTGPGPRLLGKVIDAVMRLEMPFVQVAGNLMGSIWNYSVGGVVNPLVETVMEAVESSVYDGHASLKNMSLARQRRIAVGISRGLVGLGILLGGQLLAAAGNATGDEPEKDSLEDRIWKAEGKIGDSIKIGKSWTNLTALAPSFTLLAIGATLWQNAEEEKDPDTTKLILHLMDQWFGIPGMIADNIADDNLWEGFIELVKSLGDENGPDLDYLAERILGNGVSQFIPLSGLMRRFAYAVDPYVRDTSAEDSRLDWKWQRNKIKAGIPWLSKTLPAQVDAYGNPVVRYPNADTKWKRAVSAFFNPATKTSRDRSNDPLTQALVDLARETGDKDLLIGNAPYRLKGSDDELYRLFGQERNLYQTELTTTYNAYLKELFGDPAYRYLTADQKDTVAGNLMDLSVYEAEKVIDDRSSDFAVKDTTDRAKLKAKIDEAVAATDEKGNNLNIDVVTYLIHNAATSGIDAKDDAGNSISGLGKARKAVAAKNADKGATPEQAYYLWRTMGNDAPFADKDQFYWYYFNGWEWNGHVWTDEEVTDRILHPEKYN